MTPEVEVIQAIEPVEVEPVELAEVATPYDWSQHFLQTEPIERPKWADFDKRVYKYEHENPTHRITRIFFDGADAPEHYVGMNSECDLSHGEPAIRLSTGEIIEI